MEVEKLNFEVRCNKPGRIITQFDQVKVNQMLGQGADHSYAVVIEPGAFAGNHYHLVKREIFCVISGALKLTFVDPNNAGDVVTFTLENDGRAVVVPAGIAHVVQNLSNTPAVLYVFATQPARSFGDDFEYKIV